METTGDDADGDDADGDDADDILDEATAVGALSAGDSLDVDLWKRFDEPGEHRLTVEVVVEQEAVDEDTNGKSTVTVTRDVVVSIADEVPIRIEYTEQGVRYAETATVALPDEGGGGAGSDSDGTLGTLGTFGTLGTLGLVGTAGLAVVGRAVRRRDV